VLYFTTLQVSVNVPESNRSNSSGSIVMLIDVRRMRRAMALLMPENCFVFDVVRSTEVSCATFFSSLKVPASCDGFLGEVEAVEFSPLSPEIVVKRILFLLDFCTFVPLIVESPRF